ncbi:splicing factor 3B subunit 3-like [Lytechinus variegatus]|uniref:splicing factor 3B subunit 3-like n=1 Tax=Lytechinus variegatus TaxID=7654 RepID=UPI001BB21384|nr:splicing factor 3B subunit 3-like [Lytechinus variegatus]XP_041454148.1 splicing factor 3B subunit 3-like [Lytechinus variegatus]XP_041454149.1 splicing factor 3B subunit 3-like [Lytechinus variegatus]
MFLYALTLQRATGIVQCIHGNFAGTKQQELVVGRGKLLELIKIDPNTGKLYTVLSHEIFGIIRTLMPFRLTGGSKDFIVVGSDSGRIIILEYNAAKNCLERVHQETFGKSGCRRIVPGQFLAVDPKGRAVMVGALEKQKLVYILNRDAQARLTISSPLEAHKSNTFSFHIVGVDVGFENPMFACLEIDYEDADSDPTGEAALATQQLLTYYELDLGLNHVVRKYSEPLEEYGNLLIAVPGGSDGPSGVLICSENYITYKNLGDQPDIRMPIPRRRNDLDDPERGMIFVCSATHKTKSMFFFLAQTEQGDIFKITLETDDDMVTEIRMKYFDTVPVATSMNVLKTGFLFIASEYGNHYLYQIAHLGDDDDEPEFSSATPLEEGDTFFFAPRTLRNLEEVDQLESLSPILACQIADLASEDTPQLYVACGRGPRSSMRVLRHGLEVSEMAVSELPGNPNAVWTVKKKSDDEYDAYIIVSFVNATLVLSIGETVEEVTDSGFLGTTPTLSSSLIGDDALLQIYPDGIRHIRADKRVNEWKTPGKKSIVKCAVNQRQVVIALTGGELVYFEMDPTGQLNEYTERKEMNVDVKCMSLATVPSGEQRARFLAVGLDDNTVRIISLDQSDCLQPLSMQALPAPAEALCIIEMGGTEAREDTGERGSSGGLFLNIGLQNGVLLRMVLDSVTGDLSDTRTRYLGSRPVKLFRINMQGSEAVLAMSSRSWLSYWYQSRFHLTPLSYETLEFASGFASEQCPEGIVAISTNTLRILALEKLGAVFNQVSTQLKFTPRKFATHLENNNIVVIESDHNTYTDATKAQRKQQMAEEMVEAAGEEEKELAAEMAEAFLQEELPESTFSSPKAGSGMWASTIRLLNPVQGQTLDMVELEQNEAAFSLAVVKFANREDETHVLVGTAKDVTLSPRTCSGGAIHTYLLTEEGKKLEFLHKTLVDDVPSAIASFQGRVLIGIGRLLRIYDLGKKKLLRKCENKHIPNFITNIMTTGNRIIVSDVQESLHFLKYKRQENQMVIFADDSNPRWITATCLLDHDTVMSADKFGNVTVLRLPASINDNVDEDPTGVKALWDRGLLNGASQKTDVISSFFIGETVLSLQKATLIPGGSESVVYTTLSGAIGVLVPFTSHEDHDFFQHLEMHMRSEYAPLCGRDHLSYRSYYYPVKNVIDGDLCEQYNSMDLSKQRTVAEELDRNPSEVSKKLEDIRTRFAF